LSFNYLANSSGFTRIAAYVGELVDNAVAGRVENFSQRLDANPAERYLNRPCDLSELMSRSL
jgi:hypothetical protein